jgi:hypothetical protein
MLLYLPCMHVCGVTSNKLDKDENSRLHLLWQEWSRTGSLHDYPGVRLYTNQSGVYIVTVIQVGIFCTVTGYYYSPLWWVPFYSKLRSMAYVSHLCVWYCHWENSMEGGLESCAIHWLDCLGSIGCTCQTRSTWGWCSLCWNRATIATDSDTFRSITAWR